MGIVVHHKISDLFKTLGLPYAEEIDFAILSIPDIHPEIPFKSPILQADYFSFILTKDGAGVYSLDDNKFPFDSKTFYWSQNIVKTMHFSASALASKNLILLNGISTN